MRPNRSRTAPVNAANESREGHVDDVAVGAVSAVEIANADRRAFGCEEIGCGLTDAAGTTGDRHYGAFDLDLGVGHYGLLSISNTDGI